MNDKINDKVNDKMNTDYQNASAGELRAFVDRWPNWAKLRLIMLIDGYQQRGAVDSIVGEDGRRYGRLDLSSFDSSGNDPLDSSGNDLFPVYTRRRRLAREGEPGFGGVIRGPDGKPILIEAIRLAVGEMARNTNFKNV